MSRKDRYIFGTQIGGRDGNFLQPTYIKDLNHAVNVFSTFPFQGEHRFLF